ncbi:hypothetical protein C8J56DRAFT_1042937 [Mycena floridula]|nr:hypothetical protein C8J56DRAFT_1042937 [Mycena floridula]
MPPCCTASGSCPPEIVPSSSTTPAILPPGDHIDARSSKILQSNVNVRNIRAETTGDIASHNTFVHFHGYGRINKWATKDRSTTRRLRQGRRRPGFSELPPNKREEEALPPGLINLSPEEPTDERLNKEVAQARRASDDMRGVLREIPQQSHRFAKRGAKALINPCIEVFCESISCANQGVVCALHHATDLHRAVENKEAFLKRRLKRLQSEAARGKGHALNIQTQFRDINAAEQVTGWWDEVLQVLHQIKQQMESEENIDVQIQKLIYLGHRFRAYHSQVQCPFHLLPLSN